MHPKKIEKIQPCFAHSIVVQECFCLESGHFRRIVYYFSGRIKSLAATLEHSLNLRFRYISKSERHCEFLEKSSESPTNSLFDGKNNRLNIWQITKYDVVESSVIHQIAD